MSWWSPCPIPPFERQWEIEVATRSASEKRGHRGSYFWMGTGADANAATAVKLPATAPSVRVLQSAQRMHCCAPAPPAVAGVAGPHDLWVGDIASICRLAAHHALVGEGQ
jgi:hypothetical protein